MFPDFQNLGYRVLKNNLIRSCMHRTKLSRGKNLRVLGNISTFRATFCVRSSNTYVSPGTKRLIKYDSASMQAKQIGNVCGIVAFSTIKSRE